jgi:hypothetical protein
MIKREQTVDRDRFLVKMHEYLMDSKMSLLREMRAQLQAQRDISRDDCMDSGYLACEEK